MPRGLGIPGFVLFALSDSGRSFWPSYSRPGQNALVGMRYIKAQEGTGGSDCRPQNVKLGLQLGCLKQQVMRSVFALYQLASPAAQAEPGSRQEVC